MELEMLKTYIETNLARFFIWLFKSLADALIPFVLKKNDSFRLCVDYQGFNNLTIKNRYPLPFIEELINCLGCAKLQTQLDLTNIHHRIRTRKGDK